MATPRRQVAQDIIRSVLSDVAPEKLDLLLEIIAIEDLHLSDKSTVAPGQIAALIEKVAKDEGAAEVK
jgi:hypothetical protein